jgi:hypothetical protein
VPAPARTAVGRSSASTHRLRRHVSGRLVQSRIAQGRPRTPQPPASETHLGSWAPPTLPGQPNSVPRGTFAHTGAVQRPGRHRLKLAKSGADVRTYEARPALRVWWPTSRCDWRPDCCSGHSRAWSGRCTFHRANDPSRPRGYLLRRKPRQGPLVSLRPAEPGTRQRPLPGGHSLTLAHATNSSLGRVVLGSASK